LLGAVGHPVRGALLGGIAIFALLLVGLSIQRHLTIHPTVWVRWSTGLSEVERANLELRFRLTNPQPHEDDAQTWRYDLRDASGENLHAIVTDPNVDDTDKISRTEFELEDPTGGIVQHIASSLPVALVWSLLCFAFILRRPASDVEPPAASSPGFERSDLGFRLAGAYLCLVLAALAIAFQLVNYPSLTNDHSGYLAMARQTVLGEWPIRDFLDHGTFLRTLVSALLQWTFGHNLLAEMLFTYGALTLGYSLVFHLTRTLTRSDLAGFLLTLSCVLSVPRPYSYTKILIYPLALTLLWRYIRKPSAKHVAILGLLSAVALMVRFDHGATLMVVAVVVVFMRQVFESRTETLRALVRLCAWFAVGALPFLVYVAIVGGIVDHVVTILEFGGRALTQSVPLRLELPRLTSGVSRTGVAVALLHDAYIVLTGMAVALLGVRAIREWRSSGCLGEPTHRLLAIVVLWLTATPMLLRDGFSVRFPDVAPVLAVLAAGIVAGLQEPLGHTPRPPEPVDTGWTSRRAKVGLVAATVVISLLLIPTSMMHGGLGGIASASRQAFEHGGTVLEGFAVSPPRSVLGVHRDLVQYADDCTEQSDRLLVTWYAPEIYFGSNRRFAGNQWLYVDYQNSRAQQLQVVRQIQNQSVPLVFARPDDSLFDGFWPVMAEYIESAYVEVGSLDGVTVLAERNRAPVGVFGELPCFATPRP